MLYSAEKFVQAIYAIERIRVCISVFHILLTELHHAEIGQFIIETDKAGTPQSVCETEVGAIGSAEVIGCFGSGSIGIHILGCILKL